MKKIASNLGAILLTAVMFDVLFLMVSLAQIVQEGRTGYWAPFWKVQAEVVLNLIK